MISSIQNKHRLVEENGIQYYTISGMEKVHSEMLRLLRIIDDIASENNISYWISSGSMIGVVRHNGFIPWDDDLDIELLKEDYIKLIDCLTKYCKTSKSEFLFFEAPQTTHCCNYFASTKFFLRMQGSALVLPVKVDIRPYNCIKNNESEIAENNRLKDIANYKIFGTTRGYVHKNEAREIITADFFQYYNYNYGTYSPTNDDCLLAPPYYEYSVDFTFKIDNLFPLKRERFEDISVPIPKDYDYILSSLYGDYMKLPQMHHRVPAACELYIKEVPLSLIKKQYSHRINNRAFRSLIQLLFLLHFYGVLNFIRYRFFEKRVETVSNYEDSKNEW